MQARRFTSLVFAAVVDWIGNGMLRDANRYRENIFHLMPDVGQEIGHMQTVEGTGTGIPTHSQLAKDHDDHPLHDVSAQLAVLAIRDVVQALKETWAERAKDVPEQDPALACAAHVQARAAAYFVHPRHIQQGSRQQALLDTLRSWAAADPGAVQKVSDREWIRHHEAHWQEMQKKARALAGKAGFDAELLFKPIRQMLEGANDGGA